MQLSVHPLRAERRDAGFDLLEELDVSLRDAGLKVQNGDVVVVSSKYLAVSQGRVLRVEDIAESAEAAGLARRYGLSPKVAEAVIREADSILGGTRGFVLASVGGIVAPNAGIDRSNAGGDRMVLYPQEPYLAAEQICRRIFLRHAARVGVIIADSRLMPGRSGTVGVSIGAGIDPLMTRGAPAPSGATTASASRWPGARFRGKAHVKEDNAAGDCRRIRVHIHALPQGPAPGFYQKTDRDKDGNRTGRCLQESQTILSRRSASATTRQSGGLLGVGGSRNCEAKTRGLPNQAH